jgi:hypothetical protein
MFATWSPEPGENSTSSRADEEKAAPLCMGMRLAPQVLSIRLLAQPSRCIRMALALSGGLVLSYRSAGVEVRAAGTAELGDGHSLVELGHGRRAPGGSAWTWARHVGVELVGAGAHHTRRLPA